jgi:GT2 family glycosyltransferase
MSLDGRQVPIHLLISGVNDKIKNQVYDIIENQVYDIIDIIIYENLLPIGQARNILFSRTCRQWSIFYDCDTIIDEEYFKELDRVINTYESDSSVKAFAGGIGVYDSTRWGMYEAYMDLNAYVGKIGRTVKDFKTLFQGLEKNFDIIHNPDSEIQKKFWKKLMKHLADIYEGSEIGYLQGFNQIINYEIYDKLGGFNPEYWSAEDREIAVRIRKNGYKIIFTPSLVVFHNYKFNLKNIFRRKLVHGKWSERFRFENKEYEDLVPQYDFKKLLYYAASCFNPPFLFDSPAGKFYYTFAFLAYLTGILKYRFGDRNVGK